jgi:KDO2-lipid IV(A) lauroyltransferase
MNLNEIKTDYRNKLQNATQSEIDNTSYSFALFSANINKFLPHIPKSEYKNLFQKTLYHKKISGAEQYDLEYLKNNSIINNSSINLELKNITSPTIFASFHLGSYRLLNSYLYVLGYKIVIIIDESVFLKQQDDLLNKVKPLLNGTKESDFVMLNINDRTSIFKLKNYIEQGYIMTVYLDGNTSLNNKSQDFTKGYIPINFLNNNVFVKNGIGKLSALLGAKIIPTLSSRDKDENNSIEFYKEIQIADFENKQEFSIKSIEISYKILEKRLIEIPEQWECWLYIEKWFKRDFKTPYNVNKEILNQFNNERYTRFSLGKSNFIFDMYDYQSYPIEQELANSVQENNFSKINADLRQELQEKNIII